MLLCAVGAAAGVCGWLGAREPAVALTIAVAMVAVLAVAIALGMEGVARARVVEVTLWLGLLAPVAFAEPRTATDVASSPVSTLNLAEGVAAGAALVASLLLFPRSRLRPLRATELLFAAYLATAFVSAAWSAFPAQTLLKAAELAIAYCLVALYVRLKGAGAIAGLATMIQCLLGTALAGLVVDHRAALSTDSLVNVPRLHGLFPYIGADILGILAAAGVLAAASGNVPRMFATPVRRTALALMDVTILLLAHSRTSIAVLVVGLAALALATRQKRSAMIVIIPVALATLALAFGSASGSISSYLHRGQSHERFTTLTGRTTHWDAALDLWRRAPLVGLGYYAGHRLGEAQAVLGSNESNLDNTWVETLLDLGLVGCALLAAAALAGTSRVLHDPRDSLAVALLASGVLASFLNPSLDQVAYPTIILAIVLLEYKPETADS